MRRAAKGLGELGERTRSVSRARGRERLKSMGAVAKLASGEGEEPEQCGRLEPGKGLDPGGLSGREGVPAVCSTAGDRRGVATMGSFVFLIVVMIHDKICHFNQF